jgi:tetratricopeptide (TPR) repeat protein
MKTNYYLFILCFLFISLEAPAQRRKLDSLLTLRQTDKEDTNKVYHLVRILWEYKNLGKYDSALQAGNEGLVLGKKLNYKRGLAKLYNNIGIAYAEQSIYDKALENHLASLRIKEEMQDKKGMAQSYLNMGIIYADQNAFDKAREYFLRSLKLSQEIGSNEFTGNVYNCLGVVAEKEKNYPAALKNYEEALRIKKQTNDQQGIAYAYSNMGNIYMMQKDFDRSLQSYMLALQIEEATGDDYAAATAYQNLGSLNREKGNFAEAARYFAKGLQLAKKSGSKKAELDVYVELASTYAKAGDFRNAYTSFEKSAHLKDTIFDEDRSKQMTEMSTKYETDKKEKEILLQKARLEKSDAESKKQRLFLLLLIAVAVAVAIIAIVIFRSLKVVKKQKSVIEKQKALVDQKNLAIEEKQREIIDSITYARRLQDAILPPLELIRKQLPESFVFYQPKDIVAGDFYWMEIAEDVLFIAAADCTGHGVPGAMVSVVCSNAMNRAVKEFGLRDTGKILDKVTDLVIETFEKSSADVLDGMDISLLAYDRKNKTVEWSGAYNPLWYCFEGEMIKIKPDKQPVGKYGNRKPFSTHAVPFSPGTVFYLFTDGYADQFGGASGKKFLYKRFEEQLKISSSLSMPGQEQELQNTFQSWKGKNEQVDDVTVIGLRL